MTGTRVTPQQLWQIIAQPMNDAQRRAVGETCAALVSQNPDSPEALTLYGFYRTRLGHCTDALPMLERARTIQPGYGPAMHALALTYVGLDRHAEADPLLRALLTKDNPGGTLAISSSNLDLVSALAASALYLGRTQEAQSLYAGIIDLTAALLAGRTPTKPANDRPSTNKPHRAVHNLLYLPVEVSARELDAKILIAAFAAREGMNVVVGASSMLTRYGFADLPPGVVLLKTFNAIDAGIMQSAIGKGHLVAVIDEEAVGRASTDSVYRFNVDPKAAAAADLILIQGEEQQEVMKRIYPETAAKMRVTGNPKTDVFKLTFSESNAPAKTEAPILICLMSGNINPNARSFAECAASTLGLSGLSTNSDVGQEFVALFKSCVSFEIAMAPQIAEAVRTLAKNFPERKIIVRPHPVESPGFWTKAFANFPNITVRADGTLTERLHDAAALVYISGSTSGLEGYLSGVPTIRFIGDGRALDPANSFSSRINVPARTGSELVTLLKPILNGESAPAMREVDRDMVSRFLHQPDGQLASHAAANALQTLQHTHPAAGRTPLEALRNYNERRTEPFKPLEFHLRKFPEMGIGDFTKRLHDIAAKAGITQNFDIEAIEFNSFLIRAR